MKKKVQQKTTCTFVMFNVGFFVLYLLVDVKECFAENFSSLCIVSIALKFDE